jgi:anti-sigma-K factor RskA
MSVRCPHRDDAGAWVLRALSDDDARVFDAHLDGCAACRRAVAELQGVADVLPMSATQVAPPPALKGRIMHVVEAEAELLRAAGPLADRAPAATRPARRRWWPAALRVRPLAVAALACVLLVAGVAAGVVLSGGDEMRRVVARAPAGAKVMLEVRDGRGELVLDRMPPPPTGRVYQVWTMRPGGDPQPTRTLFTVPADGRARVAIEGDLRGVTQVLVSDEPPSGSRTPTTLPVVGARMT